MILTRNPKVYSDIDIETIERYECDAGLAGSDSIQAEMRAERPGIRNYTLQPGEIYLGRGPAVVTTILGSCVAVTMHDAKSGISAICHGLLPSCSRAEPCKDSCPEKFKFVECSIKKMLDKFDSCGINRAGIEVKMFGGSDMFGVQSDPMNRTVGRDNIKVAQETIEAGGLQIAASDTGGNLGRKIIFITHTGDVFLKRLVKS
jgi:chemotaxis protein CheD